jgi:hypothetical protein
MKPTMHLYETHLPVKDTEVSSRFYVDVVGLQYAHRDLTRDVVFLWIGSKKRSMLGLWGPTSPQGQFHRCHFAVAVALSDLLTAGPRLSTLGRRYAGFFGQTYNRTIGHRLDAIGANLLFRPRPPYR